MRKPPPRRSSARLNLGFNIITSSRLLNSAALQKDSEFRFDCSATHLQPRHRLSFSPRLFPVGTSNAEALSVKMPFGQLVIGPPGSGKSTYCYGLYQVSLAVALQLPIAC